MSTLPQGFYTALGTPLDKQGNVLVDSLASQVRMQVDAGAAGLLVLGSMGIQAYVKQDQCPVAVETVQNMLRKMFEGKGSAQRKKPVLLAGVMDNSVERVLQRVDMLAGLELDGVVATTPFYNTCNDAALLNYFTRIADRSPFPLYMYDLPGVTKMKINYPLVKKAAEHPNIMGIKTGDPVLTRLLWNDESLVGRFSPIFSGLDIFDVATAYGINRYLDGMFACCPKTTGKTFELFAQNRFAEGGKYLDRILDLRDTMFRYGIFPAFTVTMNLLGLAGSHAPDFEPEAVPEATDVLRKKMIDMGEIS